MAGSTDADAHARADGSRRRTPIIRVRGLVNRFGEQVVHEGLDLDVRAGEILGVVGGSGTGKSVLMRSILGLRIPDAGEIEVLGTDARSTALHDRQHIERNTGVLFQDGALFSSLTVGENVQVPLKEHHAELPDSWRYELALLKVKLAGPAGRCAEQAALAAVRRHAQARRAGPRAGAGSAAAVPGRTHRRAGPDRRGRLRPPDPDPAAGAGPDRVPHHPRPGHPVRYLRPGRGAGRPQGGDQRADRRGREARPPVGAGILPRPARARRARRPRCLPENRTDRKRRPEPWKPKPTTSSSAPSPSSSPRRCCCSACGRPSIRPNAAGRNTRWCSASP